MVEAQDKPIDQAIQVCVVEDYKLVRLGLLTALRQDIELSLIGDYETADDFLTQLDQKQPDVVLMDIGLPGTDGIEAVKQIKAQYPHIKAIMLTSHNSEDDVLASLAAGAEAYCIKDIASDHLIEVIKDVYQGAVWLDPTIARIALSVFAQGAHRPSANDTLAETLTDREQEILELMVQGYNNSQIAEEIYVSVHTVKVHVSSIFQKLSVNDRVQAAVKAVREGLVSS